MVDVEILGNFELFHVEGPISQMTVPVDALARHPVDMS